MTQTDIQSGIFWRPDLEQVILRYREWYAGERRYLITVTPKSWNSFNWDLHIDVPTPKPLQEYDFSDNQQLYDFLGFRLKQYEVYWQTKKDWGLDDDFVPVFEPRLGWAEVVAPLVRDAQVRFCAQTSHRSWAFKFTLLSIARTGTRQPQRSRMCARWCEGCVCSIPCAET